LAVTRNKKKTELDAAKNKKDEIEQEEEDYDKKIPGLQRKIILLSNEVSLLDCTLNIYELTYKEEKTFAEKQLLVGLWEDLENTFQTDKMKRHLDHVLKQLKSDPSYKEKSH
jgi:hypothetical protein